MEFRAIITSQYHAALDMLKQSTLACPKRSGIARMTIQSFGRSPITRCSVRTCISKCLSRHFATGLGIAKNTDQTALDSPSSTRF